MFKLSLILVAFTSIGFIPGAVADEVKIISTQAPATTTTVYETKRGKHHRYISAVPTNLSGNVEIQFDPKLEADSKNWTTVPNCVLDSPGPSNGAIGD